MKKLLLFFAVFLCCLFTFFPFTQLTAQLDSNLEMLSLNPFISPSDGGSDIWGYTDENGVEYAIIGRQMGISVWDVSEPTDPELLYEIPGASAVWRDMKTFNDRVYIVNDNSNEGIGDNVGDGLVIIDMSGAPSNISHTVVTDLPFGAPIHKCHNIFIDEDSGYAYLFGCDNNTSGAVILDLNQNPDMPSMIGTYFESYVHDGYVRNDTLYACQVFDGTMAIIDVSVPSSPVIINQWVTSSNFTHNCWLSDDGRTLYTTDEVSGAFIDSYDVSNPLNVVRLDKIQSSPGEGVIPHNTFCVGDFLVTSYYRDGVTIHDAKYPDQIVEVGRYDTSPNYSGDGFNGCWGVYPYFPSGNIIASDIEEGLYVLRPTYVYSSRLEVNVSNNGNPLQGASVTLVEAGLNEITSVIGQVRMSTLDEETYTVLIERDGFVSQTSEVQMQAGERVVVEVELEALESFTANISVVNEFGIAVPEANVIIVNEFSGQTNQNGVSSFSFFSLDGPLEIIVGAWGYQTTVLSEQLNADNPSLEIVVNSGYDDGFFFDYGWTVSGDAVAGNWERATPNETFFQNNLYTPSQDATSDYGNFCFVTGNGTETTTSHDVDDGNTVITSPSFDLSTYGEPILSYDRFFANGGGQGDPLNDQLTISISNGNETVILNEVMPLDDPFQWVSESHQLKDFIELTNDMRLFVETGDLANSGHVVDAAFDAFKILDEAPPELYALTGSVKDENDNVIPNIVVNLDQLGLNANLEVDENGFFDLNGIPEGIYNITVGAWGYLSQNLVDVELNANTSLDEIVLVESYYDDFSIDLGWAVSGDAVSGKWERGITQASTFESTTYNPDQDVQDDVGVDCFVTGLESPGDPNENDVDNGSTILLSPVFDLSGYENPYISYNRWFANGGGSTFPNDNLEISIVSGDEIFELESVSASDPELSQWSYQNFRVGDFLDFNSEMQLMLEVKDGASFDHITEAGFDAFKIVDSMAVDTMTIDSTIAGIDNMNKIEINFAPNPFNLELNFQISDYVNISAQYGALIGNVYDLNGKLVKTIRINNSNNKVNTQDWNSGVYVFEISNAQSLLLSQKLIKQ